MQICRQASHETVLQVIKELHEELKREANQERASDQAAISVQVEAAADGSKPKPRRVKRKRALKEKTTRALNKALIDKINLNLAQAAPARLSNEEQRYRRFATGLSSISVSAVTQIIAKASAAIFAVWKRQNHHGKKLFQTVAVEDALRNMVVLASPSNQEQDEVGLTAFKTENFAYKYFNAQKTYKIDGLYEEFKRLAKEVKRQNQGTGVAKCNPDVIIIAKRIEPLFLACIEESAPPPKFAFLENLTLLPQTTQPFTLFLLTQDPNSEQRFEEEESNEGQPNAVPRGDLASIADSLSSTLVSNSLASTPAF
ncbi:hypothetical protein K504DRAFT_465723 [Pleomassaria siparia CBS 279.74]|uniref:Uncharacterized protein n=1 Tax=Pleomassaria siparia CBS 279.74 TaxID=1314801 RepID=A0A6G1KDE0_9PLEO|nr:hypothetical protein K504DRAFT_465723 [Pleomassaria siparia CBS 279.74]